MDKQISTTKVNKLLTQGKIIKEWDSAMEIGLSAEAEILTRGQNMDTNEEHEGNKSTVCRVQLEDGLAGAPRLNLSLSDRGAITCN